MGIDDANILKYGADKARMSLVPHLAEQQFKKIYGISPKFAGGYSQKSSSTRKSGFGHDEESGVSTPCSSSHLSFESNGEPVVNPKKLHTEVSSILMGFSKAKKAKPVV
jgi:hypothetical protein